VRKYRRELTEDDRDFAVKVDARVLTLSAGPKCRTT
jgi:hypothetical protein